MYGDDKEKDGEERPRIVIEDKRLWHEGDEDDDDEQPSAAQETPAGAPDELEVKIPDAGTASEESAAGGAAEPQSGAEEKDGDAPHRSFEVMGEPSGGEESAGGIAGAGAFEEMGPLGEEGAFDEMFDAAAAEEDLSDVFRDMTPEDEERLRNAARQQLEGLSKLGIENYLRDAFNVSYILSLQYLGIQPNPTTNLTSRDLKRASICIDVIDYLRQRLADFLTAEERAQLQALVASLKMEYSKIYTPPSPPPGK